MVAAVAIGIVIGISGHTSAPPARPSSRLTPQQVASENRAAEWVVQQVSRSAIVSCDQQMCAALKAHGFPAGNIRALVASNYPTSSTLVIETPAVHKLFGTSLDSQYAPLILTRIGSGSSEIEIRVIAKNGTTNYQHELATDLASRQQFAGGLLGSTQITTSSTARHQLEAGVPDGRTILAITILAGSEPVDILGFGNVASDESQGVPLRYVDLTANDPASGLSSSAYVKALVKALGALPAADRQGVRTSTIKLASGASVLRIAFPAPSPFGVLQGGG